MAATERLLPRRPARRATMACRLRHALGTLLGGVFAAGAVAPVLAADLAEDKGEAMYHRYQGGGVTADGPALLVRKRVGDSFALTGSYYVDMVSNASIDVVTTASPYKENRTAYDLGVEHVVRDSTIAFGLQRSREPDYVADGFSVDVTNETFGGMTTVALGFSRGKDKVGKKGEGFFDTATHWQYRLGVTQILSPRWLASVNMEVVADDGFLGSPYRVAQVRGAYVPENNPRARTSRAVKFRSLVDIGERRSVRAEYRYFWDTWGIKAHTLEAGAARHVGDRWIVDAFARFNKQSAALFYADNAAAETTYVTRNRQLGSYDGVSIGGKVSYAMGKVANGALDLKLGANVEALRFKYSDFTDLRSGGAYSFTAAIVQIFASATY